jgi:hypothetical protein
MGRAGTALAQESFYSTLECELLAEHAPFSTAASLRRAIADYLDYCITTSGGIPPAVSEAQRREAADQQPSAGREPTGLHGGVPGRYAAHAGATAPAPFKGTTVEISRTQIT